MPIAESKKSLVQDITPEEEIEEQKKTMKTTSRMIMGVYAVLVLMGIGTGYLLSNRGAGAYRAASGSIQTETVVGSTDAKTFKDSAEGMMEAGGADGEGSHKLIRDGGPSQTAYLVSSVVDLDQYVGKKVRVWGQTMGAKKVSWLMDVGKIELLSE
jgi:hypothetical protein